MNYSKTSCPASVSDLRMVWERIQTSTETHHECENSSSVSGMSLNCGSLIQSLKAAFTQDTISCIILGLVACLLTKVNLQLVHELWEELLPGDFSLIATWRGVSFTMHEGHSGCLEMRFIYFKTYTKVSVIPSPGITLEDIFIIVSIQIRKIS